MDFERGLRGLMYLGLIFSGIFITLDPSELVARQVSDTVAYFWSISMALSALICACGAITDRWIGEFTGLPLLISVLAFYGISAILAYNVSGFLVVGYGLTMIAFALGLIGRYRDVRKIRVQASRGTEGEGV